VAEARAFYNVAIALGQAERNPCAETVPDAAPQRILLVEDNPGDATLLREAMLEVEAAVEIEVIPNAILGLAFLTKQAGFAGHPSPHLVILDINLPLLDGLSALAAMRASPSMRDLPVWVLTSSARVEDRERALALGAVAYSVKPATFERYLVLVEEILAWFAARRHVGQGGA
jgi:CheY-like chemotaxis protein